MYSRRQALLLCDAPAQISQLDSLFSAERGTKMLLVLGGDARQFGDYLVSAPGEMQSIIAAIFGAAPALEDPLGFEFVN